MKNRNPRNPSNHHIIPRSKGGKTQKWNIALIEQGLHQDYHKLFVNRTPLEILAYLSHYFWRNGDGADGDRFIRQYINNIPYRID